VVVSRQHDVGQQTQLGVHGCGSVDGGDDGHFDIEKVQQQAAPVLEDLVPLVGIHSADPARVELGDELVAGTREDHDAVVGIAPDIFEEVAELGMGPSPQMSGPPSVCNWTRHMPSTRSRRAWAYDCEY
jgi:hypothetical protein